MATTEDVLTWNEKYGSPLSGGVIVRNEKGEEIGRAPYSEETNTAVQTGQALYQQPDQSWSLEPSSTGAFIELDKETGDIKVKNLSPTINQERFNQIASDLKLEQLSQNYKVDKDYAYPVSDSSSKTVTVEDIIKSYNDKTIDYQISDTESIKISPIESKVMGYLNVDKQADAFNQIHQMMTEEGEIKPLNFTDQDVLNYFTNQQTFDYIKNNSREKWDNSKRLMFTPGLAKDFGINVLDSWDAETNSVGVKDFMENYYSRENANWEEKQEVDPITGSKDLALFNELEKYVTGTYQQDMQLANGNTFTGFLHRDDKTEDMATAISLYNFLKDTDPVCNFWQGAGDKVASAFNGVESSLEKLGEAGATGLVLLADGATWVGQQIFKAFGGDIPNEDEGLPSRLIAKWAGYSGDTSFYDVSGSVREQGIMQTQQNISNYNAKAASVFTAAQFITDMAIMINVGNAVANYGTSTLSSMASTAATKAAWFNSAAEGAATLASTQAMGSGLYTAWQLTGNVANAASSTLNLIATALQWKGTTAAVSVLFESAGEALIQNPSLVGQLLTDGNLSSEAKELMFQTVAGNALGMTAGHGLARGLEKFGKTPLGVGLSRNLNRFIWTVRTWAGDSLDAARLLVSKYDTMEELIAKGSPTKYAARMNRQMVRSIQKQVLKNTDYIKIFGQTSDEIIESIAKYDKPLGKYLDVERSLDAMSSRGVYTASSIVTDPNVSLSGSYKTFEELADELISMGKSIGLKSTTKGGVSVLPEAISDYITTKQHIDILNSYANAIQNGYDVGESLSAIQKELTHFGDVLEAVSAKLTPDIIAKSDGFIEANRRLWSDWTDYRVEKGLLDAEQIANLRKSEQWGVSGELYVGQLRKVEKSKYTLQRADSLKDVRTIEEVGKYRFGSTNGFVDPMLTFQSSLLSSAQKLDRQIVLNQFVGTEMVAAKYTTGQLNLINTASSGKKALGAGVQEAFQGAMENIKTGTLIDKIGELQLNGNKIEFVAKELLEGEVATAVDDMVDGFYEFLSTGNSKVANMLDSITAEFAPEAPEATRQFLIYGALQDGIDKLDSKLKLTLLDELQNRPINGTTLNAQQIKGVSDDIADRIKQNIKDRFDYNRVEVSRLTGKAQELIDREAWNAEIRSLAEEIGDAQAHNSSLVTARNADGELTIFECDPLLATFMNVEAPTSSLDGGTLAKINYAWMRLFRFGTTGVNPVSWVNQFFRDYGNAWLVGGATQTITEATDILTEAFGVNPAYYMSQFSEEFLDQARRAAATTGERLEEVLAKSEISYGKEVVGTQLEAESLRAYTRLRDAKYINGQVDTSAMSKAGEAVDNLMQKADWVNNKRESWLRSRVYANSYADAIKQGKTISQARTWAQFYSSNATTNFTRATTFLSKIQNTIPYLRSAINGTKSFWRLWQVDPVGVTGRIVGGLVMPMIGLYTVTLNDPANREVYKNIKEYQKDTSLAFVVDGQPFFIPIPQEVATIIAPIRQMVEGLYRVNTNSFSELAFSDILGLSPVDLSGFAGLDNYKIYEDGFWERMQAGVTKVAAQCLPKYANTLIALATNRDLYTGNRIDTSYTTVDPDTGEARVMDYTSGQFAKALHSIFPGLSAAMAENILKNTIGQAGVGAMNWIVDMINSVSGTQAWEQTGQNIVQGLSGALTSPLTNYVPYSEAQVAWRQAIGEAYNYKESLMQSDEYKAYMQALSKAQSDPSESSLNAISVQRQNLVEGFYDRVKQMVANYQSNYSKGLSQEQFASVVSLLVMYNRSDYSGILSDEANDKAYNSARLAALESMQRLGFTSVGEQDSIFGRVRTSSNGNIYVEYNNPLAILGHQKSNQLAPAIHEAQLVKILDDAGLTTSAMAQGYNKLKTKSEKKQYRKDWNAKVTKAIAPYIQQYGVEAVFRNKQISERIDDYFYTDNYYSAKNYLQEIFGE